MTGTLSELLPDQPLNTESGVGALLLLRLLLATSGKLPGRSDSDPVTSFRKSWELPLELDVLSEFEREVSLVVSEGDGCVSGSG